MTMMLANCIFIANYIQPALANSPTVNPNLSSSKKIAHWLNIDLYNKVLRTTL